MDVARQVAVIDEGVFLNIEVGVGTFEVAGAVRLQHEAVVIEQIEIDGAGGVARFYGKAQVTSTDGGAGYGLPTYSGSSGKALGSYTICYSSVGSLG